ncbi:MAG TPA: HypC/HybG/HupF family hydrogenase formation chaperone [Candidatus Scatomorpha intestinavium]|uniref:HypC/HybG/HupF family hydrogenase formation chaperone n=1 Tax=Candidatus Scatomorpha intestinavium TaxID=2840922 RepID=A0A9D0ZEK2_9FIRM|nr:HypC/HybG/HupF family hydrogenase formation chaperone [Candidatus Scatomorpha intestinavium]
MCLAVPLKIVEIDGLNGVGEVEGLRRRMRLDFIKEPRVGEYVIVHAGFAIERLSEEQAKADIAEWNEVRDALL